MAWLKVSFSPVSAGAVVAADALDVGFAFLASARFVARGVADSFREGLFDVAFFFFEAAFFFIELRLATASAKRRKYGLDCGKCQARQGL
jgi:hypothetical protein